MEKVFIGVDPSRKGYHQICVINESKSLLADYKIKGNQATIKKLKELVTLFMDCPEELQVLIGIEYQDGSLLDDATQVGVPVYALNAYKVSQHIASLRCSKDKSDAIDAYGNASYLASAYTQLKEYQPPSELIRRARDISHQLNVIRQQSTKTWQRFWSICDRSCPELKALLGESAKTKWFLTLMSDLFSKKTFCHTTVRGFSQYCQKRRCRLNTEGLAKLLGMLKGIHKREMPELLSLQARSLSNLKQEGNIWVVMASQTLQGWPLGCIALTVTGLASKTLIRLLAYIGEDWSETCPVKICAYSGIAPVVSSSGTPNKAEMRRMHPKKRKRYEPRRYHRLACNRDLKTTLCLFAFATLTRHRWAQTAYDRFRQRGQGHWEALRNLAVKWIRIIYRLIETQLPYDDSIHEKAIARRCDPLVAH